jgi:hypothetical protein
MANIFYFPQIQMANTSDLLSSFPRLHISLDLGARKKGPLFLGRWGRPADRYLECPFEC